MAEDILRDNPELRPFVLSNVRLTGTRIGAGAYASVEEVAIPVDAAAKKIHEVFLDRTEIPDDEIEKAATEFVKECQLMSTLRHPHLVQFLGVCFLQGSRLPALVMERLLTSLHDLLAPETQPPPGVPDALSFFTISLKCSVLHNVASGLAYLHERSPPVIHRDLSARNVLLNSGLVAKIADLGVARIVPRMRAAATMTKAPGASVYMPPEAVAPSTSNREKSKYDASIDAFSFGVVTIFTIGETFPCNPLAPNYTDEKSGLLVARTELQRHNEYMENVNFQLRACGQLCGDHPLIRLIQQCLQNLPTKRPGICEVLSLLEEARAGIRDEESERNKYELVRALQNQPRNQNLKHVLQDLVTENAELQSSVQENDKLQQQLQSSEREKQTVRQQLQAELMKKEAELTRAYSIIMREQQLIQEMRQQEANLVLTKGGELAQAQEQLKEKEEQLRSSEALVADLRLQQTKTLSYRCQVSGPGMQSATIFHPTHVIVELPDSDRPCLLQLNVTAQLELVTKATPTSHSRWLWSKKYEKTGLVVVMPSSSRYEVFYTAIRRGQHKLHVQVNDREINGSPFTVTVYPDPTQLGCPLRVVTGLKRPYSLAFNKCGEMIVSEWVGDRLSIIGQTIRTFGSLGDSPDQIVEPAGIAIDYDDNIYVSSDHKLQKFTSSGELIKCVGQRGTKEGEFNDPRGVTLYDNQMYVCDRNNHRIQVFDLDLNFVRSIGSHGNGRGEFNIPLDVRFDTAGNMYIADNGNDRVQVMDSSSHFIRSFGQEGKGKLSKPSGLHITDKYMYVADLSGNCIVVYETSGQFVTSFGKHGQKEGEFSGPRCITSSADGFIHICDTYNDRVQIF